MQGGLYNNLIAALKEMNMSDSLGNTKISIYVLKAQSDINIR